jgi:hypothetical protein
MEVALLNANSGKGGRTGMMRQIVSFHNRFAKTLKKECNNKLLAAKDILSLDVN